MESLTCIEAPLGEEIQRNLSSVESIYGVLLGSSKWCHGSLSEEGHVPAITGCMFLKFDVPTVGTIWQSAILVS